jgi:glycosyltransferase involved in cell wall biosynthesis
LYLILDLEPEQVLPAPPVSYRLSEGASYLETNGARRRAVLKLAVVMGREPSYTRNRVILDGLASAGVDLIEYTDTGGNYPLRFARVLARFIAKPPRDADAVLVGFYGQPFIPFISRLTKKPIVLDAFLSGYDTMCFDRKRFGPRSLRGRFFYRLDKSACERCDLVVLDTDAHARYFAETFGVRAEKFRRVFVGADTSLFYPRGASECDGPLEVFYYCTYHPVHGTEYVIRAASLLDGQADIHFTIVGAGQERRAVQRLGDSLGLSNTDFVDWIPYRELPEQIAKSDVCLGGHFGTVDKSSRVIPGKAFQFLAMAKPTIMGDNPANRELLRDGRDALLVKMADPRAIADAVLALRDDKDLRESIARNGHERFRSEATPEIIGAQIAGMASSVISVRA